MNDFQPLTIIDGRDPLPTPHLDRIETWASDVQIAVDMVVSQFYL